MILYELRCAAGHGFEAWFRNSDTYDQQYTDGQVECPICGVHSVSKAPMAPRIGRGAAVEPARPIASPAPIAPDQIHIAMSKIAELNKHIAETCDYVGDTFPEEARKIHYGEAAHREIYGEASPKEAAELHEEGIDVSPIPWLRRSDS
jgi:hypothetical protein